MKFLQTLKPLLAAAILLLTLTGAVPQAGAAYQNGEREVQLTLLPDFERGRVAVDGKVSPGTLPRQAASLADWGTGESLTLWQSDNAWNIHGPLPERSVVSKGENGRYHLRLGPFSLKPGDSLALLIPFANIHWQQVTPPPDNLAQLTGPATSFLPVLRYAATESPREIQLDIPFTPVRKEIELVLTPLIGETLAGRVDSFRFSGQATFTGLKNFTEFERLCEMVPDSRFYRYRVANLLFALDYPPIYHFGFLNPAYQFKPNFSMLRSNLAGCQFEAGSGQITAQFNGRAFQTARGQSLPPPLQPQDVAERHRQYTGFDATAGEYEITMGEIVLAPGDRLRVSLPHSTITGVSPAPTQFLFDRSEQTQIEYRGPKRFTLAVRYKPNAQLPLRQLPATGRALLAPLETSLGLPWGGGNSTGWSWALLITGAIVTVAAGQISGRRGAVIKFLGWLLLAVALLYGARSIFGWLLLAVGWYFGRDLSDRQSLVKGAVAAILVLLALLADTRAEALFSTLNTIKLGLTPLTPLILLLLGAALYSLLRWGGDDRLQSLSLPELLPLIFFLFSLAIYDVLQNSLPALLLVAGGAAYAAYKIYHRREQSTPKNEPDWRERLHMVRQSWLVPAGVLLFTIFAMRHNLQQTEAVFGPALGLWGAMLTPVLLFISVLLAFSAIALLFILLYPLLPFKAGSLKAIGLGLFLLAVFVLGVGSDDRLMVTLNSLLAGRLVYYLSIPLLVGLYFDIDQFRRDEAEQQNGDAEEATETLSFEKAAQLYLKQLKGFTGTAGSILSLVAPSLYAYLFDQPIVTTYFDLLEQLISFSI